MENELCRVVDALPEYTGLSAAEAHGQGWQTAHGEGTPRQSYAKDEGQLSRDPGEHRCDTAPRNCAESLTLHQPAVLRLRFPVHQCRCLVGASGRRISNGVVSRR